MTYVALPTKNPGDVLTSLLWNTYLQGNADSGFMRKLADSTLGVATAQIDFAGIPQTFAHLMLVVYGRSDDATNGILALQCRLNGDTGTNYDSQQLQAAATTVVGSEALTATSAMLGIVVGGGSAGNRFGATTIHIPHYTDSANFQSMTSVAAGRSGTASGNGMTRTAEGLWRAAAAVTEVTVFPSGGNFQIGTRATLYGLPA